MERLEFDKSKFDFYAYLRKSSKNSTQDLSLNTQNIAVKNFIENYTNIDFETEVNIVMEVASAYKKKQKINMKTWEVEDANNQRPEFKEMLETIQQTHYKTWKKAIIFLYNTSRLTRNIKDGEQIKSYLWINLSHRFLDTAPIEKIIFTLEKVEWNNKTDDIIIDTVIAENKGYSKNLSKNIKGAISSKLDNNQIPWDLRIDYNTPFKNEKWIFKVKDNFKICKLLKIKCGIKITPSNFKAYFKREIFSEFYTNKETWEVIQIPFDTVDGKMPLSKQLLEYILMNKKNTGLEYGKMQESDFIAQILKTEDWRKASYNIPWKAQGKKAIYYNFSNKQSIAFLNKFSNKNCIVDAVDNFKLLPKLLFIYCKMHCLVSIQLIKKQETLESEQLTEEELKNFLKDIEKIELKRFEKLKDFKDEEWLLLLFEDYIEDLHFVEKTIEEDELNRISSKDKEYISFELRILKDLKNIKNNIYNMLFEYFKPYLKTEENDFKNKEVKKEIDRQIKEQEELKNRKILYCLEQELPKEMLLKALKPFELEIEKLKEQKKELENQALNYWDFQTLINSFEKIFNIILSLDIKNIWTLSFRHLLEQNLLNKGDFEEILKNTTFELILYPDYGLKIEVFEVFNSLVSWIGCGDRIRTYDLRVMSPTR